MAGFSDALLSLSGFLNTRTPDRRPTLMEGVTPAGRQALGGLVGTPGGVPGNAANTGAAGALGGAGTAGLTPQTLDLSGLGATPDQTGKPGPNQDNLQKQYANLGKKETRIRNREAKRLGRTAKVGAKRTSRTEARTSKIEARLGKRSSKISGLDQSLLGGPQTGKTERREAVLGKTLAGLSKKEALVSARGQQQVGTIAKQTAGRESRITKQSDRAFNRTVNQRNRIGKRLGYG